MDHETCLSNGNIPLPSVPTPQINLDFNSGTVLNLPAPIVAEKAIEKFLSVSADVAVIDLDRSECGWKSNGAPLLGLIEHFPNGLTVGGGIPNVRVASDLVKAGAKRVIVGSALFDNGVLSARLIESFVHAIGPNRVLISLDVSKGMLRTKAFTQQSNQRILEALRLISDLPSIAGGVVIADVDASRRGTGPDWLLVRNLRNYAPSVAFKYAGSVRGTADIERLASLGLAAVLGQHAVSRPWQTIRSLAVRT